VHVGFEHGQQEAARISRDELSMARKGQLEHRVSDVAGFLKEQSRKERGNAEKDREPEREW
jgi:hypothetical protein